MKSLLSNQFVSMNSYAYCYNHKPIICTCMYTTEIKLDGIFFWYIRSVGLLSISMSIKNKWPFCIKIPKKLSKFPMHISKNFGYFRWKLDYPTDLTVEPSFLTRHKIFGYAELWKKILFHIKNQDWLKSQHYTNHAT